MKINPINKSFNRNFLPIALLWGGSGLLFGGAIPHVAMIAMEKEELAKKEIQVKDPLRYERLIEKDTAQGFFSKGGVAWTSERNAMNDSLKVDAMVKRAYFEGAQMVRDSIATANKK